MLIGRGAPLREPQPSTAGEKPGLNDQLEKRLLETGLRRACRDLGKALAWMLVAAVALPGPVQGRQ